MTQVNTLGDDQRLAAGVQYDGSAFSGWQRQRHQVNTVQGVLEAALSKVANHPVEVVCAGRTDAGVHGVGQVMHFDTTAFRDSRNWVMGANANLPSSVSINWVHSVDASFHARFSAQWRRYVYVIANTRYRPSLLREQITWIHKHLDEAKMQAAASLLVGEHDFSAFRAAACQAKTPVRTVFYCHVQRAGSSITIDIKANAFLYHMVRNIVGSLIEVGSGDQSIDWFESIFHGCQRELAGATAKPNGLYFAQVGYPAEFAIPTPSPSFPLQWLNLDS